MEEMSLSKMMKAMLVETYLDQVMQALAEVEVMYDPTISQMGNLLLARKIYTQHAALARNPEALIAVKILLKEMLEEVKVAIDSVKDQDLLLYKHADMIEEIRRETGKTPDDQEFAELLVEKLRKKFADQDKKERDERVLFASKTTFTEE